MSENYKLNNWIELLPAKEADVLRSRTDERFLEDGEFLYHQGEYIPYVFEVVSGSLKCCRYSENGSEFIASLMRKGDCGGDVSVLLNEPAMYNCVARGKATLRVLPKKDFLELRELHPAINSKLVEVMALRYRFAFKRLTTTVNMPVRDRFIWLLMWLVEHNGEPLSANSFLLKDIRMADLFLMLATARQTLSKEFQHLTESGILRKHRSKIIVSDFSSLKQQFNEIVDLSVE